MTRKQRDYTKYFGALSRSSSLIFPHHLSLQKQLFPANSPIMNLTMKLLHSFRVTQLNEIKSECFQPCKKHTEAKNLRRVG